MKLAVLIINYETPEYIEKLVKQFTAFNSSLYDLYIVDNSIENRTPYATQVNAINLGFDQTVIAWLQEVKEKDYAGYWLLNSDCELDLDAKSLERYLLLLENDKNIGLIGSRVIAPSTDAGHIPQYFAPEGVVSVGHYVDFQSTVISKELLQKFDFTDCSYFHGGLDLDFNLRCKELGMLTLINGQTTVLHECDASIKRRDNTSDLYVHCLVHALPFIHNSAVGTIMTMMCSILFKRYPQVYEQCKDVTDFLSIKRIKDSLILEPLFDYGEWNYAEGKNKYNFTQIEEALQHLKKAAVCGVRDAYIFVTSILEIFMRFDEEAYFMESLQTIQELENTEYSRAQRDTYCVSNKPKKRFVFHVLPDAGHPWDDRHTKTGIGGSEIAVIQLTRCLAELGQEVIVFNNCAEEGFSAGVTWYHKDKFDSYERNNPIDVLIVSRYPEFRFVNPRTQVYFWAHDLNYYKRITTANWQFFDKFLVLSRYHYRFFSEAYPFIPSTHYEIMTNGVDLNRFNQNIVRNPKKLIYSSNPDRGLHHLFDIFAELYKWDNKLELHVFGYYPENIRKHPDNWKEMPGVIYRGYTEQHELAAEYLSSRLWVYPCSWLETFCITAIEAQAAGTPAIVSDWGCLRERVGNAGIVIPGTYKDSKHITDFIEATKLLLTNEAEWNKYSEIGKKQAQEYTWYNAAATLLKISNADNKRK